MEERLAICFQYFHYSAICLFKGKFKKLYVLITWKSYITAQTTHCKHFHHFGLAGYNWFAPGTELHLFPPSCKLPSCSLNDIGKKLHTSVEPLES